MEKKQTSVFFKKRLWFVFEGKRPKSTNDRREI